MYIVVLRINQNVVVLWYNVELSSTACHACKLLNYLKYPRPCGAYITCCVSSQRNSLRDITTQGKTVPVLDYIITTEPILWNMSSVYQARLRQKYELCVPGKALTEILALCTRQGFDRNMRSVYQARVWHKYELCVPGNWQGSDRNMSSVYQARLWHKYELCVPGKALT